MLRGAGERETSYNADGIITGADTVENSMEATLKN